MPQSTIIDGRNKTIGRWKGYGIGDPVSIAFATADDETARRPAMASVRERNKPHIRAHQTKASDQYLVEEPQRRKL